MENLYSLTLQGPYIQYTVHAHSESQVKKALGLDMVALRRAVIRPYGAGEQVVNNHSTLRNPGAGVFLRMRTMEEAFRRPDCEACRNAANDNASKGRMSEHKRLGWQLFSGDATNAYQVTLQNPFQEVTVRAHYQSYIDMFLAPLAEIRHPKIRKYAPGERQARRYCDLTSGRSDVYRTSCQNLAIFLAEGSLRALTCEYCLEKG
ncbi:hypothetical protein [Pseudomonas amygdali]|uniref:Uncharacterized protein n=1 Tax=Pseudomonas amygdali pv. lachrymans str. M301315 TaxID=629260 RepID=A0AAD0V8V7_PSEAV|nr:hypothetical protein [Pseudomonas amygdali]AXH59705.1 hypothetical protein PLA107_031275 [Pseudomonas amygdali pv. lachrymans str. M301315]RMT06499.1 hypothetical protein ALP54_03611 [Pseudomonas amygdali pv. lachrymans]